MPSVRTFISFTPPNDIWGEMNILQSQLEKSGARVTWEHVDKFHSTITFLGDVDEIKLPSILDEINAIVAKHQAFDVTYEKLGVFPNIHRPKVIWIGCTPVNNALHSLKHELDSTLAKHGFEIEKSPFRPHVTLGRIKGENNSYHLTPMLENLTFEPRRARIEEIYVMKSILHPQGAAYSILTTNQLQQP